MPFYWYRGPPNSIWDLDSVEDVVTQRYYAYSNPVSHLEYDLNNLNNIDSVGHLFMCFIAIESNDMKNTIFNGELKIFKERLDSFSIEDLKSNLLALLNFLNEVLHKNSSKISEAAIKKCKLLLVKNIVQTVQERADHVFHIEHKLTCRKSKAILPFTFPLSMISKREIEVKNGQASVNCGKWKVLLQDVFHHMMLFEIDMLSQDKSLCEVIYGQENDQIRQVLQRCIRNLYGVHMVDQSCKRANDVDNNSKYFAPCMANLHQILRRSHRLSYESRYQYTLFLKDIGLPVDENISFWEQEYRKPQENCSCAHQWDEKEARYKYQIRHMYGLIGSYSSKSSHSCSRFIEPLHLKMDGGCPFQHFSEEKLRRSLPQEVSDIEDIFKYKLLNEPQKACAAYLRSQHKTMRRRIKVSSNETWQNNVFEPLEVGSPLQYYYLSKNISQRV